LDAVYEEEQARSFANLEGTTVSYSLDGWGNVKSDHIVSVSITTEGGDTFLLDSIDTSGNSHTGEYLLSIAKNSIHKSKLNTRPPLEVS